MVINWPEVAFIVALNGVFLLGLVVLGFRYVRKKYAVLKPQLLSEVEIWMGGAIGRFMQNLSEQAAEEEGIDGSSPGVGTLKLGGFQVDTGTIKELLKMAPQLIQLAQSFGLIKGGGSGGGAVNPFLKP